MKCFYRINGICHHAMSPHKLTKVPDEICDKCELKKEEESEPRKGNTHRKGSKPTQGDFPL